MRVLALARYRFWTTLRSAGPILGLAFGPAFAGAAFETLLSKWFPPDPSMFSAQAAFALIAWLAHCAILIGASLTFGSVKASRTDLTSAMSDLIDSTPIEPRVRFIGEMLGVLGTTLMIHLCCLPGLAITAALSPHPTVMFVCIEAVLIPMIALSSASAAWRRLAPPTRWGSTRAARSGLVFVILVSIIVLSTRNVATFRDAAGGFLSSPSMRKWQLVAASFDNPFLLFVLLGILYIGYMTFFYIAGTRDRAALGEIA